jgi:hypothetical protein
VTGDKQHFLPAALIGGFGRVAASGSLREAEILWRRRGWQRSRPAVAENIGYVNKMYRLAAPPPGVSADRVDELWDQFEGPLPGAIVRAAARQETSADRMTLIKYVAAAGVRHPDFGAAVNRWRAELGMRLVTGDEVHVERVSVLTRGLKLVEGFRWRFVHSPAFGPRLVLNDRGWSYIGQQDWPGRGLWVPLNSKVALLAWLQRGVEGVFDHLTLWPGWATGLNTATWVDAPSFVAGHPDDGCLLDQLTDTDDVAPKLERFGPYRDRRLQGLFTDFL